jgi:hypothetical protein
MLHQSSHELLVLELLVLHFKLIVYMLHQSSHELLVLHFSMRMPVICQSARAPYLKGVSISMFGRLRGIAHMQAGGGKSFL